MIVADTGAIVALLDASEDYHPAVRDLFEKDGREWIIPSVVLPEVDYLVAAHLGAKAQDAFLADLADGLFSVDWGRDEDLTAARQIHRRYRALRLGFVDAMVIATAQRLKAEAIATLDLRHFAAVEIKGTPRLLPRDL